MHGWKKQRKRSIDGATEIDGYPIAWELVAEPHWTPDGHRGLRVAARLAGPGAHRELVVEYPYDSTRPLPQRPQLTPAIVEADLREAMDDGWNPESRGRPYHFMARTALLPERGSGGR